MIDLGQLPEEDRKRFLEKVADMINETSPFEFQGLKKELKVCLQEVVDKFNNSEEAKSLGIWLDLETLYHDLQGHLKNGKIVGCHINKDNCCFEFVEKTSGSNGVREGVVRMKDRESRKLIKEKPSTTVFCLEDKIERILEDILEAIRRETYEKATISKTLDIITFSVKN